jgi:hypothetical protein
MSKLTDFIGQMTSGMARTNRYSVGIALPIAISQNIHSGDVEYMQLLCESVTLPSLNVNTTQIRTFGEIREMPTEFNYDPVTLTFYVDGNMIVKNIFDTWIKSVQQGTSRNFSYYNDYICDPMVILVENLADEAVYEYKLYEAWPKTVAAVNMSYEQKDVMKLTVTMMFKHWQSRLVNGDPGFTPVPQISNPVNSEVLPANNTALTTVTNFDPYTYTDPMGNIAYNYN